MNAHSFEHMLTGGHPNSLGRIIEVVDAVLAQPDRLADLYACYFSSDEIVRLRTSNAIKRMSLVQPQWLVPYIDRLLTDVANIDQASAQWTLAHLCGTLHPCMTPQQYTQACSVLERTLDHHDDWIVLNTTMQTLAEWSAQDAGLREWLRVRLEKLREDRRKSVAGRARKLLAGLH